MQPQKIALVSKLKVENLLVLKKNHEDTREPTNSSKPDLRMPLTRSSHLMENADNISASTQRKTCFHPVFPSPPTIPLHVQPQNIYCPFLSKKQNPSSLFRALWGKCKTLFLPVSFLRGTGHISGTKVVWRQNLELLLAPWLWLVTGTRVGKGYRTIQCNN